MRDASWRRLSVTGATEALAAAATETDKRCITFKFKQRR